MVDKLQIQKFFAQADNICDYIPIVSSISNIVDLVEKVAIASFYKPKYTDGRDSNYYYSHLENKSGWRCALLLIPVIGNITVAIADFVNRDTNNKKIMLEKIKRGEASIDNASYVLQGDLELIEAAEFPGLDVAITELHFTLPEEGSNFYQSKTFLLAIMNSKLQLAKDKKHEIYNKYIDKNKKFVGDVDLVRAYINNESNTGNLKKNI